MAGAHTTDDPHAGLPLDEAAARSVRVRTDELFAQLDRAGEEPDAGAVHDVRVATRRLRAALEVYAPCFPAERLEPVLRDLKALATDLGVGHDADVALIALERFAAEVKAAGVEAFAARTRADREGGDELLDAAVARAAHDNLRGRLLALAEAA
ncbi:MAG: CHAD domain-containing protein [Solirubrobacteraceae bacterium]